MQFLENSVIGLRAARHRFARLDGGPGCVTLFPMVHVADPGFYAAVRQAAAAHDFVLTEGIDAPVVRRLTASYRWINVARLGLALQSRGMFDDLGERAIRADLSGAEFEALWQKAPLGLRLFAGVGFPAYGLWQRYAATRASLAGAMDQDEVPDRDTVLSWGKHSAPFFHAVLVARDARLCSVLRHLLQGKGQGADIAVVYGAGHMPAASKALRERGYRATESEWLTAIEAE